MVMSKASKRSAFQPGSIVYLKRGSNLRGVITAAIGSKRWNVKLTCDGKTTEKEYTSQQLRHPKDHELLQDDDSSSSSNSSNAQVATTGDEQPGAADEVQPPPHAPAVATGQEQVTTVDYSSSDSDSSDDDSSSLEIPYADDDNDERGNLQNADDSDDDNGFHPPHPSDSDSLGDEDEGANLPDSNDSVDDNDLPLLTPRRNSPDSESNNEEEDPDEDLSEDLPSQHTGADENEADISGAAFAAQLEPEDDKYRKRQEFYKIEKQKLIDDKWTVKKKPSKQNKLAIGATVQERSGPKRSGLIVSNGSEDRTWMVQFERSENDEQLPSSRLKLVQDNSEYVWTIVKDSIPTYPVTEYRDVGLVGVNFGTIFSDTSRSNEDYDFPYLHLLQTLWPGKFKFK
jgi:hypothetical protein